MDFFVFIGAVNASGGGVTRHESRDAADRCTWRRTRRGRRAAAAAAAARPGRMNKANDR